MSWFRKKDATLAIVDSQFPQAMSFGFRNMEINEYLRKIKGAKAYAMYPMVPGDDAWFTHSYGVAEDQFNDNLRSYLGNYPYNKGRVEYLSDKKTYKVDLAYSLFLAETYTLLPFYEKNNMPFVFVLYPGGGFGLENKKSDAMLKKVCSSPLFRGVITTQAANRDYLIKKSMCPEEKIHHIYGGFVQFTENEVKPRLYYKKNKDTLDICFVAAKYSEKGVDKGYDVVIEAAKKLCKRYDDVQFHIVGGFDESDIPVDDIKDSIKFYGFLEPKELIDFYQNMDICLSPNRPYELYEGNFDGFPMGVDAGYCGTPLFVSDPLGLNEGHFEDGKDIAIIDTDVDSVSSLVEHYRSNPDELVDLAIRCRDRCWKLFDVEAQIKARLDVFGNYMDLRYTQASEQKGSDQTGGKSYGK